MTLVEKKNAAGPKPGQCSYAAVDEQVDCPVERQRFDPSVWTHLCTVANTEVMSVGRLRGQMSIRTKVEPLVYWSIDN